jgi:hypothetical protein
MKVLPPFSELFAGRVWTKIEVHKFFRFPTAEARLITIFKSQFYHLFPSSVAVIGAKLSKMFLPIPDSYFLLITLVSTEKFVSLKL